MVKVTFDFNVSAWIRNLEIEADSYEDAERILNSMSLDDLVSEGYVKDFQITDKDYDIEEDEDIFEEDEEEY